MKIITQGLPRDVRVVFIPQTSEDYGTIKSKAIQEARQIEQTGEHAKCIEVPPKGLLRRPYPEGSQAVVVGEKSRLYELFTKLVVQLYQAGEQLSNYLEDNGKMSETITQEGKALINNVKRKLFYG